MEIGDLASQSSPPEKAESMDPLSEIAPGGLWTITELEATARDEVDLSIWESAVNEERTLADAPQRAIPSAAFPRPMTAA